MATSWLRLALLALLVLIAGCAHPRESVAVASWRLLPAQPGSATEPLDVQMPAKLAALVGDRTSYTLRARVELPSLLTASDDVELVVPGFRGRATLQVNGLTAVPLHASRLNRYRSIHPLRFRLPASDALHAAGRGYPKLDLRLTVAHHWSGSASFTDVPRLTLAGGESWVEDVDDFNHTAASAAFATASFITLFYGALAFWLEGARRRTYAFFALGAAANLFYPALMLGFAQPVLGPYEVAVCPVMLMLAAVAAVYSSSAYFGLPAPHAAWRWVATAAVIIGLVARDPFHALPVLGPLVVGVALANTLLQLWIVLRLRRASPQPRNLYFVSLAWPATAVLGVPDFVEWTGWGTPLQGVMTANVALTVISLLQAFALLRDHTRSLGEADAANAALAERVAALEATQKEIGLLNDELRRQMGARSRRMVDELARTTERGGETRREGLGEGEVVEGRYRVLRRLGQGGMGAVYEVERLVDGQRLALKLLTAVTDAAGQARFAREAQIAANVSHPNVVALVDFDVAAEGFIFLVFELVEGTTLRQVRRRMLDIPWTLLVLAQVADGLDAIHAQGVVHRDLKPANVLVSRALDGRRPQVKITDFGVSTLLDDLRSQRRLETATPAPSGELPDDVGLDADDTQAATRQVGRSRSVPALAPADDGAHLTRPGMVFGTPHYMAAELVSGDTTRAADLFSLGVIAYELLTLQKPFDECPLRAAVRRRPLPRARPIGELVPTLDAEVAALIDRAISHDPLARPTARELAICFRRVSDAGRPPL